MWSLVRKVVRYKHLSFEHTNYVNTAQSLLAARLTLTGKFKFQKHVVDMDKGESLITIDNVHEQ